MSVTSAGSYIPSMGSSNFNSNGSGPRKFGIFKLSSSCNSMKPVNGSGFSSVGQFNYPSNQTGTSGNSSNFRSGNVPFIPELSHSSNSTASGNSNSTGNSMNSNMTSSTGSFKYPVNKGKFGAPGSGTDSGASSTGSFTYPVNMGPFGAPGPGSVTSTTSSSMKGRVRRKFVKKGGPNSTATSTGTSTGPNSTAAYWGFYSQAYSANSGPIGTSYETNTSGSSSSGGKKLGR